MNKKKINIKVILPHILVIASLFLLWLVMTFASEMKAFSTGRKNDNVTLVENVTIRDEKGSREAILPEILDNLAPDTEVEVIFHIPASYGGKLFFGSVYAPLRIYMDGSPVYIYGKKDSFPSFFIDPPTNYDAIPLPERDYIADDIEVRMVYNSPKERDTLSIHAPFYGSDTAILSYLLANHGITFLMAGLFLAAGFMLMAISLLFYHTPKAMAGIFLPGMMTLSAGAWQFGENTLSVYLLEKPSVLYIMDFSGLFVIFIPLYLMAILYLELEKSKLLKGVLFLLEGSALVAFILEITGIMGFHRSLYYFHFLLPAAILILTVRIFYEAVKTHSRNALLFFLAFLIMVVAALLELLNYYAHLQVQFSFFFQIGLFLSMLVMAVISGLYVKDLTNLQLNNMRLENENRLKEQAIEAQKSKNTALLSHYDEVRKQRHDIRHHLRTIDSMIHTESPSDVSEYIHSIQDSIPGYVTENFCENPVVNSTLGYYSQMAKDSGIRLTLNVQVPASNHSISDADLCVLFGNLMENAIEACRRMRNENRYISLQSRIAGDMLFISMDNSYEGSIRLENGDVVPDGYEAEDSGLLSSKHDGVGTGLQSISSVCQSHQGSAAFTVKANCFQSEVCIRL